MSWPLWRHLTWIWHENLIDRSHDLLLHADWSICTTWPISGFLIGLYRSGPLYYWWLCEESLKTPSSRPILIYFEFRSKPSLTTVIWMDPHSPKKFIATKYCFPILGDDTSFFFFLCFFVSLFCCFYVMLCYLFCYYKFLQKLFSIYCYFYYYLLLLFLFNLLMTFS